MREDWFEITVTGPADKAEFTAILLMELGCSGLLEDDYGGKKIGSVVNRRPGSALPFLTFKHQIHCSNMQVEPL